MEGGMVEEQTTVRVWLMSECYGSTAENKETNLLHMESGKQDTYQRVDLKTNPRLLVGNGAENTGCGHAEGECLAFAAVLQNESCSLKVSGKVLFICESPPWQ